MDNLMIAQVGNGFVGNALHKSFKEKGIETKIKHSVLMNNQPAYDYLPKFDLPVADRSVNRILSLTIHEKLSQEDL